MSSNGRKIHNLNELNHVAACNRALADKVEQVLNDERMPVTLGGCHSIAIGSISGVVRKTPPDELCILWVDAHLDLNTNTTSPSGNSFYFLILAEMVMMFFYRPYARHAGESVGQRAALKLACGARTRVVQGWIVVEELLLDWTTRHWFLWARDDGEARHQVLWYARHR